MAWRTALTQADAFSLLTELAREKKHPLRLHHLRPPAFTKSGATVKKYYRGYKEINPAMKLLPGRLPGHLPCSHFMTPDLFRRMLWEAAADAAASSGKSRTMASPDHPILWGVPETEYLKFYLFQVI